jgi:hypothetical protein
MNGIIQIIVAGMDGYDGVIWRVFELAVCNLV